MAHASGDTEYVYLARSHEWNFADRSGPEFQRDDRGEYLLDELPSPPTPSRT
ncbi:hypothetical protein AB0I69_36110 [Streptomyces sp. NPDC050508]|uniref:hypothetical protein n=1 Tax=Streptomyces sp. NPDC050508 TaxID=3155405 RepID=UPI00341DFDDD